MLSASGHTQAATERALAYGCEYRGSSSTVENAPDFTIEVGSARGTERNRRQLDPETVHQGVIEAHLVTA